MGFFSSSKEKTSSFFKNKATQLGDTANKVIGVDDIKNNFNYIKDSYSDMLKNTSKSGMIIKNKRNFDEVIYENGITDEQLKSMYFNNSISSYLFMIGLVVCLGLVIHAFIYLSKADFIFQLIPSVAIGLFCALFSLRYSMLCHQIKHRDLVKFKEFLNTFDYFPTFKLK